ncbi:MAG: hypothetical protein LUE99_03795 [Bacteroides sp.]|nr:hypothetical protein [Bacteroides sp.]
MGKEEQKQSPKQAKQILVFSTRLRHEIRQACRQLEQGEGQEEVTINKEVDVWLNN